MKKKLNFEQVFILIVMIGLFIFIAMPVWTAISISFMSNAESLSPSNYFIPADFSLEGYKAVFEDANIIRPLINTLFVTSIGTLLHMLIVSLAGYGLIQTKLPGGKFIAIFFMITMMVPAEAIMIPRFLMFQNLGMINNLWSIILISLASGFSILLLENYFKSISFSLAESARIDGASEFKIYYKIYVPLAKNGFLVVMLFDIVTRWNEYSSALLLLTDPNKYLIQQAIKELVLPTGGGQSTFMIYPNLEMAVIVIGILPIVILYFMFQKQFVGGMNVGGVKE
ncbi:carbohydrate ABC transporter permease [Mollicutes bacterium LVI A0039]|nr:carbohydrate ABC transporter permease [Mollicutes bacterium LVI A0039]